MAKSIFVDIRRCTYCRACEIACAREHKGIPLISPIVIDEKISVPISCRQCEKAPCITICTPKALVRNSDGAIIVDLTKCNGCRFCIMACPYKAIQNDPANKAVKLCDLCASRTRESRKPVCVSTCPTGALVYGELEQLMSMFKERAARDIIRTSAVVHGYLYYIGK